MVERYKAIKDEWGFWFVTVEGEPVYLTTPVGGQMPDEDTAKDFAWMLNKSRHERLEN